MTHRVNHLMIRKLPAMYSYPFIFHLHRLYDLNKAFYRDGEADLVLEQPLESEIRPVFHVVRENCISRTPGLGFMFTNHILLYFFQVSTPSTNIKKPILVTYACFLKIHQQSTMQIQVKMFNFVKNSPKWPKYSLISYKRIFCYLFCYKFTYSMM